MRLKHKALETGKRRCGAVDFLNRYARGDDFLLGLRIRLVVQATGGRVVGGSPTLYRTVPTEYGICGGTTQTTTDQESAEDSRMEVVLQLLQL